MFLRVVVAGKPPRHVVACEGKLGVFLLNDEVVKIFLLREFVAQSHTFIIHTETDNDSAVGRGLVQGNRHFIIVVAHLLVLSPHRGPSFVERGGPGIHHSESLLQVGFVHTGIGMLVFSESQSQFTRLAHGFPFIGKGVGGASLRVEREIDHHIAIRRFHFLRFHAQRHTGKC